MAATSKEIEMGYKLRAKGYTDQQILQILKYRRDKIAAEAAREAKIAEALKKQEEAEKAAFEEQKLDQASIYAEYDA